VSGIEAGEAGRFFPPGTAVTDGGGGGLFCISSALRRGGRSICVSTEGKALMGSGSLERVSPTTSFGLTFFVSRASESFKLFP
jgi:hypothetical protein